MSTEEGPRSAVTVRLQKFLARAGVASRRGSENLMTAGRVTVNGAVVTELGVKVVPGLDRVCVDGVEIALGGDPVFVALNKPAGVVTTMSDPQGRPTVGSFIPVATHPGLFPVGRLDFDTTGLLLFTTDGELSHRLLHPKWKVPKTYRAEVDGSPDSCDVRALRVGVTLDDGVTAPADVRIVSQRGGLSVMEISIREGRKRQVRRMFSAVGHPVVRLERISFGPIELGDLREGEWRYLEDDETSALYAAVGLEDEG